MILERVSNPSRAKIGLKHTKKGSLKEGVGPGAKLAL